MSLQYSQISAYKSFVELYNLVGTITHNDFQRILDRTNPISLLLLSHYLAAHVLLRHISIYEVHDSRQRSDFVPLYRILLGWTDKIDTLLPTRYKPYNEWPRSFVDQWL